MEYSLGILLLSVTVIAASSPLLSVLTNSESPLCPAPSGMFGTCIFVKGRNCLADSECTGGKVCCSEGCGKVCKEPVKRQPARRESPSCPASSGLVGICIFVPGVNCLADKECTGGKLCCSEGCGKVCKDPVHTHSGTCPKPSGTGLDICMFQPGVNCVSDSECGTDEKCCPEGCNNICRKSLKTK